MGKTRVVVDRFVSLTVGSGSMVVWFDEHDISSPTQVGVIIGKEEPITGHNQVGTVVNRLK